MTGTLANLFNTTFDATGALCAETDPEAFFPAPGDHSTALRAKRVCNDCQLLTECLSEAVVRNYTDGIWGGSTPTERNAIRKDKAIPLQFRIQKHISKIHTQFAEADRKEEVRKLRESLKKSTKDKARRSLRKIEVGSK
jgi:hypothetical protein